MKAIVIGATGAVGQDLVKTLLYDDRYETVTTFTRRPLGFTHPKIESFIVDFDRPFTWRRLVKGDPLFRPGYVPEAGRLQGGPVPGGS